ncbi:hypothetical protein [Parvularcula dongshanensis]|nr:hypothetical protein [Parvularcula dongshanensis]
MGACAQGARLPPPERTYPAPEPAQDWENWGDDRTDVPPGGAIRRDQVVGTILEGEALRGEVAGVTLNGCYPSGERFSERLATNGNFYNVAEADELLGQWSVVNDRLCFRYPERAQAGEPDACFSVSQGAGGLHFYAPDLSAYVASTRCPMRLGE